MTQTSSIRLYQLDYRRARTYLYAALSSSATSLFPSFSTSYPTVATSGSRSIF